MIDCMHIGSSLVCSSDGKYTIARVQHAESVTLSVYSKDKTDDALLKIKYESVLSRQKEQLYFIRVYKDTYSLILNENPNRQRLIIHILRIKGGRTCEVIHTQYIVTRSIKPKVVIRETVIAILDRTELTVYRCIKVPTNLTVLIHVLEMKINKERKDLPYMAHKLWLLIAYMCSK